MLLSLPAAAYRQAVYIIIGVCISDLYTYSQAVLGNRERSGAQRSCSVHRRTPPCLLLRTQTTYTKHSRLFTISHIQRASSPMITCSALRTTEEPLEFPTEFPSRLSIQTVRNSTEFQYCDYIYTQETRGGQRGTAFLSELSMLCAAASHLMAP